MHTHAPTYTHTQYDVVYQYVCPVYQYVGLVQMITDLNHDCPHSAWKGNLWLVCWQGQQQYPPLPTEQPLAVNPAPPVEPPSDTKPPLPPEPPPEEADKAEKKKVSGGVFCSSVYYNISHSCNLILCKWDWYNIIQDSFINPLQKLRGLP